MAVTLPSTAAVGTAFLRLFIVFVVAAWSIYSLRKLLSVVSELRERWGNWETAPIPDTRATRNLALLCLLLAGWALFTGGLTFALGWVLGV